MPEGLYDTDLVLWAQAQVRALRGAARGSNEQAIDFENVAEEIENLARTERRALASHIATVIQHLMKLEASPAAHPRQGWQDTIDEARDGIARLLKDSPSLRAEVAGMVRGETSGARVRVQRALARYGEIPRREIATLAYREEQVLGDWLPAEPEA